MESERSVKLKSPQGIKQPVSKAHYSLVWTQRLLVVALVLTTSAEMAEADSCPYAMIDQSHTMCVFKPRMCHGKKLIKSGGLSCMDKEIILMSHNHLRQSLALGRVSKQPAALNMETMVWSDELAEIAQRWADQCMPGHDRSRDIIEYTVGQNVAAVWTYEHDEGYEADFHTQIEAWFNEVMKQGFSKSTIEPFRYSKIAGHYTQLAWADTYMVGCGFSYYHDQNTGYTKLYVCNYAPGGNIVGGSMYKVGYPGQQYCVHQDLKPNINIQGLCVRDDISYQSECSKHDSFFNGPLHESHSSSHSSHSSHSSVLKMTMMPPPPPPLNSPAHLMMLMDRMNPPPLPSFPPTHQHRFHSTTSQAHSHFNIHSRNSFHHNSASHFKKGIPSPFKTFKDLFNPWKIFNKLGG